MRTVFNSRRLTALLFFAMAAACAGNAAAAAEPPPCPDTVMQRAECTKEIRIWNNTARKIYVVLQAVPQKTDARGCTLAAGGGDVWLQAAFGDYKNCYRVDNDYYVYINPKTGIAPRSFASLSVPWWSKRKQNAPDLYVDWWRGARIIIFDDQTALDDSYSLLKNTTQVSFAAGSPIVSCGDRTGNACLPGELQIYRVPEKALIATRTPFQLNEFTFADVKKVAPDGKSGGEFIDFNQNYNVSDVDQVYLPIAIEPVGNSAIGYLGTTSTVAAFRTTLRAFSGPNKNLNWPVYNNPVVSGTPTYPVAGIRVPSTATVLGYYAEPYYFPDGKTPQIIPATPPPLVRTMMNQWTDCTKAKGDCPQADLYQEEDKVFADSYSYYYTNCKSVIPPWLQPVKGSNPPAPPLSAYLRFVYGWVPFNVGCAAPDLPTVDMPPAGNRAPIDYINLQYNYQNTTLTKKQWFNPFTQLIHDSPDNGGLAASAYAFSIDDHASFLSNAGGGLIVAVGGANGLPNPDPYPPPTPPVYRYFDFSVDLGAPAKGAPIWAKYGVCSATADVQFPPVPVGSGYSLGVDPSVQTFPCTVTLTDSNNQKYRLKVLKAAVPPKPIWPLFTKPSGFDPTVMSCPSAGGVVPPAEWCDFINEVTLTSEKPPVYSLATRVPLTTP
jgi:hypothetical protein